MSNSIRSLLAAIATAIPVVACDTTRPADAPTAPLVHSSAAVAFVDARTGPFPSDKFTVADPNQRTGRRINLPFPDCALRPTDCEDVEVLNTLDGFNLQPRLSIPFAEPIDPSSATSESVFLLKLADPVNAGTQDERTIGINQVVWDPATNTLHAESDQLLEQHTRYAIIVTRAIRDASGSPIDASEAFRDFRQTERNDYKHALLEAVHAARLASVYEGDIAAASVFTGGSIIRPEPARFFELSISPLPEQFNYIP